MGMGGLRKFLFIVWLVDSALLAFLFGYIFLHGSTPDRARLAGDLGTIWGGSGAVLAVLTWKAKKQKG